MINFSVKKTVAIIVILSVALILTACSKGNIDATKDNVSLPSSGQISQGSTRNANSSNQGSNTNVDENQFTADVNGKNVNIVLRKNSNEYSPSMKIYVNKSKEYEIGDYELKFHDDKGELMIWSGMVNKEARGLEQDNIWAIIPGFGQKGVGYFSIATDIKIEIALYNSNKKDNKLVLTVDVPKQNVMEWRKIVKKGWKE